MFGKAKSEAIRFAINKALAGRYGEIKSFKLESKEKSIALSVLLNGEAEAIDIEIGNYEIDDSNPDEPVVVLSQLKVSRGWMQELASDQVEGKRFDIPAKFTGIIKMIL